MIIGSFLNITATLNYLIDQNLPVVIHCAGWKETPNIEDTLYAGALTHQLMGHGFLAENDAAKMALDFYLQNKNSLLKIAVKSDHAKRLKKFGITKIKTNNKKIEGIICSNPIFNYSRNSWLFEKIF